MPRRRSTADSGSRAPGHQALGPYEHHHDEEGEREDVAPLQVEVEAADRDDKGENECGDEAAREVAEAPEHADEERDRPEREPDEGMYVVLQDQQARGQAG